MKGLFSFAMLDINDNELDNSFEITFNNLQDEEAAKAILRTHTGIDQLKKGSRMFWRGEVFLVTL